MPTIEMMTVDYEGEIGVSQNKVFNVEAAVGQGAPNRVGDVMLVQAMLKEMSLLFSYEFHNAKVPDVTGRMDKNTLDSIWAVQRTWSRFLLAVDGRIDPASLAGRKLRLKADKQTMIQMLNRHFGLAIRHKRKVDDHIIGLLSLYPKLRAYVHDKTSSAKNAVA